MAADRSRSVVPEFDLIENLLAVIHGEATANSKSCIVDAGDDAAVLEVPAGQQIVISTDVLNEGVHFSPDTPPDAIGHKVLAVSLSDLAAMGAEPAWFFLSLSLPDADRDWLDSFARGMAVEAARAGIHLAGGDTTRGPMSLTATVVGVVEQGMAITRSGAQPGDKVIVSGKPGRAASALADLEAGVTPPADYLAALQYPQARYALGRLLKGHASACIDVSDGLLADLRHILDRSGTGARIFVSKLPGEGEPTTSFVLAGGDDYELCFCLPEKHLVLLERWSTELDLPLTIIGEVTENRQLDLVAADGSPYEQGAIGYEHFT